MKDMLQVINMFKDEQDQRDASLRVKIESISQITQQNLSKNLRDTEMMIDPLTTDMKVVKEKEFQVGKEFEYMLKQATGRMNEEVGKVQEELRRLKVLNEQDALRN